RGAGSWKKYFGKKMLRWNIFGLGFIGEVNIMSCVGIIITVVWCYVSKYNFRIRGCLSGDKFLWRCGGSACPSPDEKEAGFSCRKKRTVTRRTALEAGRGKVRFVSV